ncbi:MAG: histidine ammonia-lyase [Candidatus Pacebacteria bacterium CG_4_10_14_3_um_filter_34_15]|nr:histidine ammonia-lyase [Candidatus Pacearchaeota archaeon]NCQ65428.1 histidine ammonia-lyase [Candidatus Paceibacterota bacterium]OIO44194.1 MAG: histidine ammonia-lyase [Candidatus Pacebacteria bacterium CG1_02_43_31]PIQ80808.1 MAG: histidine ammonia-lyase [Candidatus Pacebacteria bacterium CG11_big_fil_rev_8_21_14_0_20_34_55]PIX81077.1 MAG: histidine ammonia-lyase [Candidatus Pacebacteria bacterium CG_4_10_14_3_um_filter_34_15]PJC43346.1 MAG: histidine ammonia-lyase [Candidatus Pacebacte
MSITITGKNLTIEDVKKVARDGEKVILPKEAIKQIKKGRSILEGYVTREEKLYGVTTGFGDFSKVFISKEDASQLQVNLIRSHNAGVGKPVPEDVARATMLARANFLASGMSGCRPIIVETLVEAINKKVYPYIPQKGSVGASGDLAPLAAMAACLMGEGEAIDDGKRLPSIQVLKKLKIKPIELSYKEGLSLINGDTLMVGYATLLVYDAIQLTKLSDIALSMTLESITGVMEAFDDRLQQSRGFDGQINVAANIRKLTQGSEILGGEKLRVQDSYVIRCSPVIIGASREAISFIRRQTETELNGSCDNPLVYIDNKEVLAGGNFHGQPLALPLDFLKIALSEIANSSEIRMERMLNKNYSNLPPFLIEKGGLNSGFMVPQYTAAGLVNLNKGYCWPNSVDSIPLCAGQEDHVSMGTNSALTAYKIVENVQYVLAIELMIATQALDFINKKPSLMAQKLVKLIRTKVPKIEQDTALYGYIEQIYQWIKNEEIVKTVENITGKLL